MNDLLIPLSAGLMAITSCTPSFLKKEQSIKQPNIIYILSDDLGYGDLGSYGQEKIKTPALDKLANEGMRFTQHYAGSTVCAPSRCVLITGQHTGTAWVRGNMGLKPMGQFPLADSIITVAELLKEAGYATGAIGKWGLGGPGSEGAPTRQGFDYFFGYKCQSHAHNFYPEFIFRNSDTVRLRNEMPHPVASNQTGFATVRIDYTPDLFAREASDFVTRHKGQPFFLYLALTPPHVNNEAPLGLGMEVPDQGEYAEKAWPRIEIDKAAMITRMDRDIGNLIETIRELGIENNTLVIFTSDNGPHKERGVNPEFFNSSGPLRGVKRDLYEGGIRVPMIAWWPGVIKAGTVSDHISAFWDFLPTACEMAGVDIPDHTDGISFLNELTGNTQQKHEYLYWEYPVNVGKLAVRYNNWKAVKPNLRDYPDKMELYDLSKDLAEENDLAPEYPEIVNRINNIIKKAHTPSVHFPLY
jgi:arylsulfatase A